jgi:hypothetical protein
MGSRCTLLRGEYREIRHRQGRLGDVGGQHDPPAGVPGEHPVLVGRGQPAVQRQHLDDARAARQVPAQHLGRVGDLPLAGQEDQDVAVVPTTAFGQQLVDGGRDRLPLVGRIG